jgi:murein DD-endopeptidase MepM/ murein hydrolase activator NlpD
VQAQLRVTKHQQQQLILKLTSARAELNVAQHRLRTAQQKLDATRSKLRKVRDEHTVAQQEYEAEGAAFGQRLRALYERGPNTYLAVVLESESFSDFSARTYLTQLVVASDVETVGRIQARKNKLALQQRLLEQQEQAEARYRTEVQAETADVQRLTERVSAAKANVDQQRRTLETQLAQLELESRQITAMLRRLQSRGLRYTGPSRWTSQYYMPVRGRISSGYGMRYHPILHCWRKHEGIDISASTGTPIHAAADGLVVFAGYMRGYGNTIMVDHGGGIHTLYAHCRSGAPFAVGNGAQVRRGQIIAYVGSTGMSTGPHVHFEVRRRGVPVNPLR